jgi:hypothetical protein
VPAFTGWSVTAGEFPAPVTGVGPAALRFQSAGPKVAPVVPLSTTLTRVRVAGWSSLLMLQTTSPPLGTVTVPPVTVPPSHVQAEAAYPAGPSSERT